jgi:hypothetical protein
VRNIAPDPAKDLGALQGPESTGDLLLDFGHSYVPFRLVIAEGNSKIEHEVKRFRSIFIKPLQQISRFGFFKSASLAFGPRPDFKEWILMKPEDDDAAVTSLEINKLLQFQACLGIILCFIHRRLSVQEQVISTVKKNSIPVLGAIRDALLGNPFVPNCVDV